MGDGAMIPQSADGSWRLTDGHARITQGLIVSPFGHLPEGCALFLELPDGIGGAWLAALRQACPVTAADGKVEPAVAIAFTWTGLNAMGLDKAALATFSNPFQEGMHQGDRKRRLSDVPGTGAVLASGPLWGGNTPDRLPNSAGPSEAATPLTIHAVALLYAKDTETLAALENAAMQAFRGYGVAIRRRLGLALRFDAKGRAREHFGFADGLSQPVPEGEAVTSKSGASLPPDLLHGIKAGDILIGHCNAHGELAPGPIISGEQDCAGCLPRDGAPEGFHNLGLDGSYLVVRELRQDVAAFWKSMDEALGTRGANSAEWLASKVVGRTLDGDMLVPGGTLPPAGEEPRNDFTFYATDPHGLGCPVGSHVRRANPRDGLAPDAGAASGLLAATQSHRILRRGRKFGPGIEDARVDDGQERGLLFMALNTDLVRQFEFIQQSWMLNRNFGTLFDESDPLLGPEGRFTIPDEPLRLRPTIATFVQFVGGEYFFLPSLLALDCLQALPPTSAA